MKIKFINWIFVFIWCVVIFLFSELSIFTGDSTKGIIAFVFGLVPFFDGGAPSEGGQFLNFVIRKMAHLGAFGILAWLVWRAVYPLRYSYVIAWVFSTVYAATDEWHQSFKPNRTGTYVDVIIDSVGALIALMIAYLFIRARTIRGQAHHSGGS
jgi:VanZ family protein